MHSFKYSTLTGSLPIFKGIFLVCDPARNVNGVRPDPAWLGFIYYYLLHISVSVSFEATSN